MEIKHDKYGKKLIWIACPKCNKSRWMRLQDYNCSGRTGLCLICHNKRGHTERDRLPLVHEGYVLIYQPNHPAANLWGFVKRAILVAETKLGRHIKKGEFTHHLNGVKDDDRSKNIAIMSNSEHVKLHALLRNHHNRKGENGKCSRRRRTGRAVGEISALVSSQRQGSHQPCQEIDISERMSEVRMKTFIEQKTEVRQQILELENGNRQLQRQADDAEVAIGNNLKRIAELYQTLREIGMPLIATFL